IGCDDYGAALLLRRRYHATQTFINYFYSFDGSVEVSGMTDHISIRIVHNYQVKPAATDLRNNFVGDSISAHFRLQVIGRNLWRRNQYALFAGERRLHATIEKECHVSILFGLRDTQILEAGLGKNIRKHLVVMFPI